MVSLYGVLAAIMLLHSHTVSTTNTTLTSSFELLQELRQIRIELCASHIDRNKTTSALDQFQKISGDDHVKDLVTYYIEFYEDNLDNLLQFLFIVKSDVQQIGYQTLFELCEANKCEIFSVLKTYKFVKKHYSNDVKILNEQVETVAVNALVRSNLFNLINFTNDHDTGSSFSECFPPVIQRIYNSNPNRTAELFGFIDQVNNITNKIKFLHVLLKEVATKRNIKHLSLILQRFKSIKSELNRRNVVPHVCCLINSMEKDFPDYFDPYLSNNNVWLIKNLYNNEYLHWYSANQFNFDLLCTDNLERDNIEKSVWYFTGAFFDEYSLIDSFKHGKLMVDRCMHNDTFVRLNNPNDYSILHAGNALRSLWTLETDNEISFVRFKNTATGDYLSVNVNYRNINQDSNSIGDMHKVVLSKIANEQTKWSIEVNLAVNQEMFYYNFQPQNYCVTECD